MKKLIIIFSVLLSWSNLYAEESHANQLKDEVQALKETIQQLQQVIEKQDQRIQALEGKQLARKEAQPVSVTQKIDPAFESRKTGLQAFNPEIGGLVDVVGQISGSNEDLEGNDKVSVRELELMIGHDIDPFSRVDITLTFSDFEDVHVEEAFVTYWGLWDIHAKLGRMRPKIGKASGLHRDQLDTVDEPLVVQDYLGVEGLFRTGLELSYFLPIDSEIYTNEVTLGVMEGGVGEEGKLFGTTRRRPSFYTHVKNFFDFSDSSNFELGATFLTGSSDEDSEYEVNALGIDLTYLYYFNSSQRLKFLSEFYFQDRNDGVTDFASHHHREEEEHAEDTYDEEHEGDLFEDNPWGFYSLVDFQINPKWSVGARWDYVMPTDIDPLLDDKFDYSLSGYVTFYQSEFSRWRLQYQRVEFADGENDDRFYLQGSFAFGVHKHQIQ